MAKIQSINGFLQEIENLGKAQNLFFRGHSDDTYELVPGIYRKNPPQNKNLIEHEEKIFREVISKSPQQFVGKNTLETLALMQHYGVPTRVLDVNESALVALYFACEVNDERDGEVIVFDIPDESVCHYNSDKVTILSNLAKVQKDFMFNFGLVSVFRDKQQEIELKKIEYDIEDLRGGLFQEDISQFFLKNSEQISNKLAQDEFELDKFEDNLEQLKKSFEREEWKLEGKDVKIFYNNYLSTLIDIYEIAVQKARMSVNQSYFGKLLHNIREDKSYFDSIIDPYHLAEVYAIRPKLDNPRIVRQQGAFLIFGIKETHFVGFGDYKPIAELNRDWILRGAPKDERIIIDKDSKRKIIKELETLGINKSTLFPEVDKIADYVKAKYLSL